VIQRLGPDEFGVFRDLRLQALREAPSAFGATYDQERQFDEEEWRRRLRPDGYPAFGWHTPTGWGGLVVGAPDAHDARVAHVYSMWVNDDHRGRGVGAALVRAVLDWARGQGAVVVRLHVTDGNDVAERLYERHGFARTGQVSVRTRDGRAEVEMEHRLEATAAPGDAEPSGS
jgi:GNAT superfamily N-acetyltransferase